MLILAGDLGSPVCGWLTTVIVGWEHVTVTCQESTAPSLKEGESKSGGGGGERGDREGYSEQKKRAEGQSSSANSTVRPENSTVSWEDDRLLPNPSTWDPQETLDRRILSDKL